MDWDLKLGRVMEESAVGEEGLQPPGRRRRTAMQGIQQVTCLVDGCTWDLNSCREYHRRHRVCERHSKTPVVLVGGEEQRFCQQCSRFHSLGEFDEAKRSCRKRLDGHNRRRRKTQPESVYLSSGSTSATGTPQTTTIFQSPPPPLFHHQLMRHPPLPPPMFPPSATTWPAHPFPPPQPSFGYVGRQHDDESADIRRDGHIDCALSLLSSGTSTRVQTHQNLDYWQQQQQQQGFESGGCGSSAAGGSHCYGFDDDDGDGAPSRMFPFTWD